MASQVQIGSKNYLEDLHKVFDNYKKEKSNYEILPNLILNQNGETPIGPTPDGMTPMGPTPMGPTPTGNVVNTIANNSPNNTFFNPNNAY